MEKCINPKCGKDIEQFTLNNETLDLTSGQNVKIFRLGCPECNHIQYTLTSENPTIDLRKRVESLEEILRNIKDKS